ncbi:hypothetical protein BSLA_03f0530 [Burkholderia stabilis]|nr:hypothetical protein BSLA_03f0530 [Burkholderia stabilis]
MTNDAGAFHDRIGRRSAGVRGLPRAACAWCAAAAAQNSG